VRVETPEIEPATEVRSAAAPVWGAAKRLLFRFAFAYLVLYNLPFPLNMLPSQATSQWYDALWDAPVHWIGKHLFHVDITVRPNGSGDTTFNYVQVFCYLVLAIGVALVWTLFDRRRPSYQRLYAGLRVYVRYALAATMITYGVDKVIELQFSSPTPDRLLQTYGESSPMGLLWTFMGFSALYCFFGGAAEMLGGLLLSFRRTTLLGALVCIGVLTNVVMLNMSFDVPVKLYSSHLLAQALFLAAPDLRRLANLFLLNRAVAPAQEPPLIARPRVRKIAEALVAVLFITYVGYSLFDAYRQSKVYGTLAPKPPYYGIWAVDEIAIDGQVRPPLLTDPDRWRRVLFPYPDMLAIQPLEGQLTYYRLKLTPATHTLTLTTGSRAKKKMQADLSYRETGPGRLELAGTFKGRKLHATLHREELSKFQLISRGFHWINEYPLNQ
jgi:hypothetical protein